MRCTIILLLLMLSAVRPLHAVQSVILDAEGYACMGEEKSRKQTEDVAVKDSKRKAAESAATYIQAETHVKDAMLEKDLLSAYASAQVKVLKEYLKEWYKDASLGDCFRVRLNVEVVPEEKTMAGLAKKSQQVLLEDPSTPLNVKLWTERPTYAEGECIKVYLKANKPFYGRVTYLQADGTLVQLLPNPYRKLNYFNGGTIYELPSGEDKFTMETCSPFGSEKIIVYASTAPLGDIEVAAADSVYAVKTRAADVPLGTRGIKLVAGDPAKKKGIAAEFVEASVEVMTAKQ